MNLLRTSGLKVVHSKVCCSSLAYEQQCAGRTRGLVKAAIRRGTLKLSARLAPWMFTYLFVAYCASDAADAPPAPPADKAALAP